MPESLGNLKTMNELTFLKDLTFAEIRDRLTGLGEPAFRAKQVIKWIYQKRVDSFDAMDNIPKTSRLRYRELFSIAKLPVAACIESRNRDAVKFAFDLGNEDGAVESVLLYDDDRRTACLSSQLGCGLGCVFCTTATLGFIRNLTQAEIIGQLIGINDYLAAHGDKLVTNLVFMGMGEALSNFDNFKRSLDIMMAEDGFNIGGRRITVSTAGVVPSIKRLMQEDLNIGLAISLNTYSNQKRNTIMPINRKHPIEELVTIACEYFNKTGRRVTFEYVVIDGENNTPQAADSLKRLLKDVTCKINLIPVNPCLSNDFGIPSDSSIDRFSNQLHERGLSVTIRKSRGRDISGACGQLGRSFHGTKAHK